MDTKLWFYKFKDQKERIDPKKWGLYFWNSIIWVLNNNPAKLGHSMIFPSDQRVNDYAQLTTNPLEHFVYIQENIGKILFETIQNNPHQIENAYQYLLVWKTRENKTKIQEAITDIKNILQNEDITKLFPSWKIPWNLFINRWAFSGRMITTLHSQFVPSFWNKVFDTDSALHYSLYHQDKENKTLLTKEEIENTEQKYTVYEDTYIKCVWEKNPTTFGQMAMMPKSDIFTTIQQKNYKLGNEENQKALQGFYNGLVLAEQKIRKIINNNPQQLFDYYTQSNNLNAQMVTKNMQKRWINKQWKIADIQKEKNISEFYNGWSSFFPSTTFPWTFQLVPRYAFDEDKKWTGTAIYNYYKFLDASKKIT